MLLAMAYGTLKMGMIPVHDMTNKAPFGYCCANNNNSKKIRLFLDQIVLLILPEFCRQVTCEQAFANWP